MRPLTGGAASALAKAGQGRRFPTMRLNSKVPRLLCFLAAGLALAPGGALARVGETRADIEKRLLQPGVGRLYYPNDNGSATTGTAGATTSGVAGSGRRGSFLGGGRGGRSGPPSVDPFHEIRSLLPASLLEVVYLKSDAPAAPAAPKTAGPVPPVVNLANPETCWHQHVLYSNGRSVMEAYVRVGVPLSEFEVNGLLALNKGPSVWKKVAGAGSIESGIGADYVLDDGSLRAKEDGNVLLIFATKVDEFILEQQKQVAAVEQSRAPASVLGF
jgi:hypothetical protein